MIRSKTQTSARLMPVLTIVALVWCTAAHLDAAGRPHVAKGDTRPGGRVVLRAGPPGPPSFVMPESMRRGGGAERALARTATIVVHYDAAFLADVRARAAFQTAVDYLETQIVSVVPIEVNAQWADLGTGGILGQGGPTVYRANWSGLTAPALPDTYYPSALANNLAARDLDVSSSDMSVTFNASFSAWYLGLDGHVPSNRYDLVSVVLHELVHGLGFADSFDYVDTTGLGYGGLGSLRWPTSFDRQLVNGSFQYLVDMQLWPGNTPLGAQLVGGDLYWAGPSAAARNRGVPPKMFAPATWQPGSSIAHLDEALYPRGNPNALMTPVIGGGEANWSLGPITRGVLADAGWTTTILDHPGVISSDFDGDGGADLLWRNAATGENILWLMTGVSRRSYARLPTVSDPAWGIAGTGDFNADGSPDVVWRNPASGENVVWFTSGSTVTGYSRLTTVAGAPWQIRAVADFNGDAKPDLLWRHATSGDTIVWFMNGTTRAGYAPMARVSDANWRVTGSADFNGDAAPDLLWRNAATGENVVWYLNGVSRIGYAVIRPVAGTNWQPGLAADFDGDGQSDILWRNVATGENVVWRMNGVSYAGYDRITTVPAGWLLPGM